MVEFVYDVDSRYLMTMTKEEISKVRSMEDFIQEDKYSSIQSFSAVSISILDDNYNAIEKESGKTSSFNPAQLRLLQSAPYSSNILIRADFQEMYKQLGLLKDNYTTPHLTIVPEVEAEYIAGKISLIDFLKEKSRKEVELTSIHRLKPGKVEFTVDIDGSITNVHILSTSGYPSLDRKMMELISSTPVQWKPATNAKGEKVQQELVFSFGKMGC